LLESRRGDHACPQTQGERQATSQEVCPRSREIGHSGESCGAGHRHAQGSGHLVVSDSHDRRRNRRRPCWAIWRRPRPDSSRRATPATSEVGDWKMPPHKMAHRKPRHGICRTVRLARNKLRLRHEPLTGNGFQRQMLFVDKSVDRLNDAAP
jgi:hypothetical protein